MIVEVFELWSGQMGEEPTRSWQEEGFLRGVRLVCRYPVLTMTTTMTTTMSLLCSITEQHSRGLEANNG